MTLATCTISGTVVGKSGSAAANLPVWYQSEGTTAGAIPAFGSLFVDARMESTYTDGTGVFSFVVPQGARFYVEIPALGVRHIGTAPASSTAALSAVSLPEVIE